MNDEEEEEVVEGQMAEMRAREVHGDGKDDALPLHCEHEAHDDDGHKLHNQ